MPAVAVVDDGFRQDANHEQLVLDAGSLGVIQTLADAGKITPVSMDLLMENGELDYDRYETLGLYLGVINRACQWWIGDWLIFGEQAYDSDRYAQAAAQTGLAEQTLLNRATVCRRIPPSRRLAGVPFGVHAEVASLSAREQTRWLKQAQRNNWTRADLRKHMKATRTDQPPLPLDGEPLSPEHVLEAAKAVLSARTDYGDQWLVPKEPMARLAAAVGEEE